MEWLRQFARLFGWKNRQYETLTEVQCDGHKIRIWRTAPTLMHAIEFDHGEFAQSVSAFCEANNPSDWYLQLRDLPHVACVAITNMEGCGVSCYGDWH